MTCSQAICKLGNLSQGKLKVPVYKERFHFLAECAGLDAKDCVDLFFDSLLPNLKLAINIMATVTPWKRRAENPRELIFSTCFQDYLQKALEERVAIAGLNFVFFNHLITFFYLYFAFF